MKVETPARYRRLARLIWPLLAAPLLYSLSLLFDRSIEPRHTETTPLFLWQIFGTFGLPLLAFGLPCATTAWYILTSVIDRFANQLGVSLVACLTLGGLLFMAGGQLRHIYGLDSPYALFFLGLSMQIAGPLASLAAFVYATIGGGTPPN